MQKSRNNCADSKNGIFYSIKKDVYTCSFVYNAAITVCFCHLFKNLSFAGNASLSCTCEDEHPNGPVKEHLLGHEEEGSSQNTLNNLGADTLVETTNAFVGNDLGETIPDRSVSFFGLLANLHTGLDNAVESIRVRVSFCTVIILGNRSLHVRIGDTGGAKLANSAQQEEVKVAEGLHLCDLVLDLLKYSVLDDGVDDQHQCGHDARVQASKTFVLEDAQANSKGIGLL